MTAKFRSRLDVLWRIATRICDGSFPSGQTIGSHSHFDTPLLPLLNIDATGDNKVEKPTYEEAIKIAFETIMADFYRIEDIIEESL